MSFHCYYCDKILTGRTDKSKDHIIPISKYGNNQDINKVDCCRACNTLKSNLTLESFMEAVLQKVVSRRKKKIIISRIGLLIKFRDSKLDKMTSPVLIGLYRRKKQRQLR
jgi:hypothetical protein